MTSLPLTQLVSAMPESVVTVLVHSGDQAQAIAGVELLDCPEADGDLPPAQLLLAVGLDPADETAGDAALRTAAEHRCVLAVKCPLPAPARFVERAAAQGVTVLAVDPRVPWTRIQDMVATLLAARAAGRGADGRRFPGGDLFALANAVAAIVGGAVAIMDTRQALVAYSNLPDQPIDDTRRRGILGRQVPKDAVADHLDKELWSSEGVVRRNRPGDLPRLAVVIRVGQDVLGSLWVAFADADGRAVGDHEATLREAAGVAALHMLALRRLVDDDQDSRNRALRSALDTGEAPDRRTGIRLPAVLLGLSESPRPLDRATAGEVDDDMRLRADQLRMLDLILLDGRSLGHKPVATVIGDRLYTLLPTGSPAAVPVDHLLDHLMDRARRSLGRAYLLVRSGDITSPAGLHEARRDIDAALDHLHDERAESGTYRTQELHADVVLRRLLATVRDNADLRTGTAERIAAHDAEHGTDHLVTLGAYLRHFGDVGAASAALHIHQNTLRQRLRRAEQTFGLSFRDPARRLLLSVEIAALGKGQGRQGSGERR
ncbi:helix-turn-helix domain-containing protein [Streptomyces sp. NPDC093544]|uniref:helix-turn-helix domain-containing protein n=1 Tax=Streptomyces sp. NPDC093544 TaxID=3155200 RepID=UPI0034124827